MSDNGTSYEVALVKGHRLQRKFFEIDVPQSPYTDYQWLYHYGWDKQQANEDSSDGAPEPQDRPKMAMYRDLRLSYLPQDNVKVTLRHLVSLNAFVSPIEQRQTRDYHATNAWYTCIYTPGAILAQTSESSSWIASLRGIQRHDIVPLQHWSDIAFLQWQNFCHSRRLAVHSLRYILQMDVTNKTTIRIARNALRNAELPLRAWPWRDWRAHPNEGIATIPEGSAQLQAILATPNGVGPAHFLLQHRARCGGG